MKIDQYCTYCGTVSINSKYCCEACRLLDSGMSYLKEAKNLSHSEYTYLDDPENQNLYLSSSLKRQFKFYIEGVQCSSCVHLLEKIPLYNSDCINSRLNMATCELVVDLNEVCKLSDLCQLIKQMGYEFYLIKSTDDVNEKILKEQRADLKRIATAGAIAGNIMLFAFAIYSGANGLLLQVFKWLNFILFLPVLFYVALPFYKGAWASLKLKEVHIDLPITIALVTSSIFSIYNLFIGSDQFYFDSTASFIFLILVARFFVKKTQYKYLSPQNLYGQLNNEKYFVSSHLVLPENIKVDDLVVVSQDQIIPVDGVLISPQALVDTAFMTGESSPVFFTQGMQILAGYKVLSQAFEMKCTRPMKLTRISELFNQGFENLLHKNNLASLSDRLSEKLITFVFLIAGLFFVVYGFTNNWVEAFNRSLALIVVACPCALAFGSPLTMAMAFKKTQKLGISIRNANVFEKLDKIKNIFFDKTGTLTQGKLQVVESWPKIIPDEIKSLILGLEKISYHPVAFSLREFFKEHSAYAEIDRHQEVLGIGVRGYVGTDLYEIKALPSESYEDTIDLAVALYKNKEVICRFYFEDQLRNESAQIITQFLEQGKKCFLLTGDKKRKALSVGKKCGVPVESIYAELYPEDKMRIIKQYSNTLMIGDGVNDSLALTSSDVSIAVKGSAEIALNTADLFFMKTGLSPLVDLFDIQKKINTTLKRNLGLSLLYNFIAGTLALFGFINPLVAAVLMPISSIVVLLSTIWGFKS